MPASAWVWAAAEAAVRAASLNLCTDELLLALGRPGQVVSVSHLSHQREETAAWAAARRVPANDGSLEGVAARRPTLLLSMGGSGRARAALAKRLGIQLIDLPYPATPDDVVAQARVVAAALGRLGAAEPYARALAALRAQPTPRVTGAFLSGAGLSLPPEGLGAQWLALAGVAQVPLPGNRLTLERLATNPPKLLVKSDYREGQASRAAAWARHPLVARLGARTVRTDGRAWTCGGLPMLAEVARLRRSIIR